MSDSTNRSRPTRSSAKARRRSSARPTLARGSLPSGARESNAGDDFHVLWAARRALALLEPIGGLRLVRFEGLTPTDAASRSSHLLLGVDLTEYYGGTSLESASSVVISQLKYSTRHPERPWTAARLAAKDHGTSTIGRLAELMYAVKSQETPKATRASVEVRLVSNQPLSDALRDAHEAARRLLDANPAITSIQHLTKNLSSRGRIEIERLRDAAGLPTADFLDLLRALTFECGAGSRSVHDLELTRTLSGLVGENLDLYSDHLYRRVLAEGLPEATHSTGMRREDMLAVLHVGDERDLLPAPARYPVLGQTVPTADVRSLVAAATSTDQLLLVHGVAGIGKTTTLRSLQKSLPEGSVVILYDCFGDGDYLSPGEARHLPVRALQQLINELALSCGTPLLVQPPSLTVDLWRMFQARLEVAARVVAARGGKLVIAIDAADNAVHAARERGEQSFVADMWRAKAPPGVTLVMTARTHRQNELAAPPTCARLKLSGFDETASLTYLRAWFPQASASDGVAFHQLTSGNPRMQFYLASARAKTRDLKLLLSEPAREWRDVLQAIIDEAIKHDPLPQRARERLSIFVALTRPVAVATFADAIGSSTDVAGAFLSGLEPGVVWEGGKVSLRDEDFEAQLLATLSAHEIRRGNDLLATHFLARHEKDAQAATVVADHLYRAERRKELVALALHGQPTAIADPVLRQQAYARRLELALSAALSLANHTEVVQVALLAADAVRVNSAVGELIRARPDLAMRHGDPDGVAREYLRPGADAWLGQLHARLAAMYARIGDLSSARQQLVRAEAWLRDWMTLPRERRERRSLSRSDIALLAEAIYFLDGPLAVKDWLSRWQPSEAIIEATERLAARLAVSQSARRLTADLRLLALPPYLEARVHAAVWGKGRRLETERSIEVAGRLLRRESRLTPNDASWLIPFCELLASLKWPQHFLLRLLHRGTVPLPQYAPSTRDSVESLDLPLRALALQAALQRTDLEIEALVPEALKPKLSGDADGGSDPRSRERAEFEAVLQEFVPLYAVRARAILGEAKLRNLREATQPVIAGRRRMSTFRFREFDARYPTWAAVATDVVVRLRGEGSSLLREIADAAEMAVNVRAGSLWIAMAERLGASSRYRAVAIQLVDRAATFVEQGTLPASDQKDILLRASAAADALDPTLARDLYGRSITSAGGLDDEGAGVLSVHTVMAERVSATVDRPIARTFAERLARTLEHYRAYVSDEDWLPLNETLAAVTSLDCASGLALLARWDDRDELSLASGLSTVLPIAQLKKFVPEWVAFALTRLAGEDGDLMPAVSKVLDVIPDGAGTQTHRREMAAEAAQWVLRDLAYPRRRGAAEALLAWQRAHEPSLLSVGAQLSALLALGNDERRRDAPVHRTSGSAGKRDRLRAQAKRIKTSELSLPLEEFVNTWPDDSEIADYVLLVADSRTPSDRIAFLDAIVDLPSTHFAPRFHAPALVSAIGSCVTRWSSSSDVRGWSHGAAERFLDRHLPALLGSREQPGSLASLLQWPFVGDPASLLLAGLRSHLSSLSAPQLHALTRALCAVLSASSLAPALTWSLERLKGGAAIAPALPEGGTDAVAAFLWSAFGHPAVAVRWRAAHALRLITRHGGGELVASLVARVRDEDAGSFREKGLPFYWMAARLWLLIALARIADEKPELLRPHIDALTTVALDTAFPHPLVRSFAARAALSAAGATSAITPEVRTKLASLNVATTRVLPHQITRGTLRRGRFADRPNPRFHFDVMNTIPYWYEPLGQHFGLDGHDIADRAEPWIVDVFGFTQKDTWNDRRELRDRNSLSDNMNDHGSMPSRESLQHHLEFHAMLLVAGQLVDSGAAVTSKDSSEDADGWAEWLDRHLDTSPSWWLADLRNPAPIERQIYGALPVESRWAMPDAREFNQELGIDPNARGWLTVSRWTHVIRGEMSSSTSVASALVAPKTAHALLCALQNMDSPNDYRLPLAKEVESYPSMEIAEGPFKLEGWLGHARREYEGVEEHDPLRRIGFQFDTPGIAFVDTLGLTTDSRRLLWRDTAGVDVARVSLWSDAITARSQRERQSQSDGRQLRVRVDALLAYLKQVGRDLIIDVSIRRTFERRDPGRSADHDPTKGRVYLLRASGRLEWLGGSRSLHGEAQPRTRPRRARRHARALDGAVPR